jgi:hypothetical protein
MRAPVPPDVDAIKDIVITEKQWKDIKDSLRSVGIDADQMTLIPNEVPLREALPREAWCALVRTREAHRLLPSEQAADLKDTIDRLQETLELLEPKKFCSRYPVYWSDSRESARRELMGLIITLEDRRDALLAGGSHRGKHTRKPITAFWQSLTEEWLRLKPQVSHKRRQHLQWVLPACARPFFPEANDKTAAAFVGHYLSEHPSKHEQKKS